MSRRTAIILGLLVLIAIAGGTFAGVMVLKTSTTTEIRAWHAKTDTLLGAQRVAFLAAVDTLREETSHWQALAGANADRARQAEARDQAHAIITTALQDSLDRARSAADSVLVYPPLLESVKAERDEARAGRDAWHQAWEAQVAVSAGLTRRIGLDSLRIRDLERQLGAAPKVKRPDLLLGFLPKPKPCLFGGITSKGQGVVGAGGCLSF